MSNVLVDRQKIDILANAISAKSGESIPLTFSEMVNAVDNIETNGGTSNLQTKTAIYTPGGSAVTDSITADTGYDGLDEVDITISAVPAASYYSATYVWGTSTVQIDDNGLITARMYTADYSLSPYNGSGWVSAGDTFKVYVDISGSLQLTKHTSTDLTVSGATITAPAGYYPEAASKSVSSMTLPTSAASSATSGYTSKATIGRSTAAQYINIPPGYNSTGAYYVISAVANGSATAPSTISGTAATVSTGTNTLTLTKTVSVTPTVSAGYVSSGTAGNSSISLTASITTKAAATYHPSTTAQTISASQYLTGAQTIAAVTTTNLSASNIVSGVTIKVGDSSDDDCVASVTGNVVLQNYYTGSSAPSSSLGNNGDLYLQS